MRKGTVKNVDRIKLWTETHSDLFIDLVRIYLGTGLFVKAIYFMTHRDFLMNIIEGSGTSWFAPAAMAHYVIMAHLFGGFLLAIGLLTRVAALFQIPILLGAVFYVYLPKMVTLEPRQNLEFAALVLFLTVLVAVRGGGRCSLDYYLARHPQTGPSAAEAAHSET